MDAIVNGCVIERETLMDQEYGEEVLCSGWNPQLTLALEGTVAQTDRHINLPADLVDMDVDAFLKKMCEYQC